MITELTNKLNVKAEDNVLAFGRLNEACGQFVNIDFDDKIIDALVKNKAGFDKISLSYDEKNGVVEDVTSKLLCLCNKSILVWYMFSKWFQRPVRLSNVLCLNST